MPDGDFNPDDLLTKAAPASATMTVKPPAAPTLSYDDMVSRAVTQGYSPAGAQGIADNFMRESGGKTAALGDYQDGNATSLGVAQWHNERKKALITFAASQGKPATDPDVQFQFLDKEMREQFPALRQSLMSAKDRGQAEDQFKRIFERPKSVMWASNPDGSPVLGNSRFRFADDAISKHDDDPETDVSYMEPGDYLALSPDMNADQGHSLAGWRDLRASLAIGDPVRSLPTLNMLPGGQVGSQDGRSRALLAQLSGLDAIPVAIKGGQGVPEILGMDGTVVPARNMVPADQMTTQKGDGGSIIGRMLGIGSAQAAEPSVDPRLEAVDHDPFAAPVDPKLEAVDHNPFAPEKPAGDGLPWDVPMTGDQMRAAQAKEQKADKDLPFASAEPGEPGLKHLLWSLFAGPVQQATKIGQTALGERALPKPGPEALGEAAMAITPSVVDAAVTGLRGVDTSSVSRPLSERLKPTQWTPEQVERATQELRAPLVARAQDIVTKRMNEDAPTTAQEAIDSFNKAREAGKPVILPDVFQDNVQSLAGRMARIPGEPKQTITKALTARNAEAVNRLTADIDQALGSGGAYQAREALANARRTAARPKYEAAFSRIKVTPDEAAQVERFIADPIGQDALQHGMRVIQLEHLRDGTSFKPADYGVVRDESGKWKLEGDQRNLRLYDAVKRGYDEIVEGFRDKTTGKLVLNQYGNAVNGVRGVYTGELRSLFPRYGSALDAWGGPSRSMDALQAGADALKRSPEQNAARLASMSENDQEFAKLGLAQTLRDIANKRGPLAGEFDRIAGTRYGSASTREQLRPFFKDEESLRKFMDSVTTETTMARTSNRVLSGSQTATRLSEDESALSPAEAAHTAVNLATGNHMGLVRSAIRGGQSLLDRQKVQRNAEISKILSDPNVQLGLDPKGKITILPSPADAATQGKP